MKAPNPAFKLMSPQTGTDYVIYFDPAAGDNAAGPRPAVLCLDGDDQFAAAVSSYRDAFAAGLVAPLWLVGVGYGASYAKAANKRGRDYTPTPHSDEPTSGQAAPFLDFLTQTLWPELGRRLPVDESKRGIAGHSLGSLFVLYALWQAQPFFTHHLASAPSIWWDNRSVLNLARSRHTHNSRLPAKLFLSVGENDSESMTGDLTLLEQQLAAAPFEALELTSRRFARRNHFNVLPDAFEAGLSTLFPA